MARTARDIASRERGIASRRSIASLAIGSLMAIFSQQSYAVNDCLAFRPDTRVQVEYQDPGVPVPCVPPEDQYAGPTIDMSQYLVAAQHSTDAKQFYLTGHMECFGGECERNGEPRFSEGMYGKSYWQSTTDGVPRFVQTKAPRAPSEFFSVRGTSIFLEQEVMTWDVSVNSEYRDHHDARGNPNHLWAKTDDIVKRFVSPNIGDFFARYCMEEQPPRTISFHDGGYFILGPYNLSTGNLNAIERELAPYGTGIERKWLVINEHLGRPDQPVELVVRVNYWGPHGRSKTSSSRDWGAQETYWYIKGAGFVRWNVAEKAKPGDGFFMWKQGTLHTPVWEPEGRGLMALGLCEQLSSDEKASSTADQSADPASGAVRYTPRRYTTDKMSEE